MSNEALNHGEIFSIATLIYARLRRVSSRVIDVMYMMENRQYAKHVLDLAIATQDPELEHLVARLHALMDFSVESAIEPVTTQAPSQEDDYYAEVSAEEIYRAQVSHHYIGALR